MYMRQVLDARDTPAQVQRLLANFEIAADKDLATDTCRRSSSVDGGYNS